VSPEEVKWLQGGETASCLSTGHPNVGSKPKARAIGGNHQSRASCSGTSGPHPGNRHAVGEVVATGGRATSAGARRVCPTPPGGRSGSNQDRRLSRSRRRRPIPPPPARSARYRGVAGRGHVEGRGDRGWAAREPGAHNQVDDFLGTGRASCSHHSAPGRTDSTGGDHRRSSLCPKLVLYNRFRRNQNGAHNAHRPLRIVRISIRGRWVTGRPEKRTPGAAGVGPKIPHGRPALLVGEAHQESNRAASEPWSLSACSPEQNAPLGSPMQRHVVRICSRSMAHDARRSGPARKRTFVGQVCASNSFASRKLGAPWDCSASV